jgi:hypothetical protein
MFTDAAMSWSIPTQKLLKCSHSHYTVKFRQNHLKYLYQIFQSATVI